MFTAAAGRSPREVRIGCDKDSGHIRQNKPTMNGKNGNGPFIVGCGSYPRHCYLVKIELDVHCFQSRENGDSPVL
jgi:hypothetical protein